MKTQEKITILVVIAVLLLVGLAWLVDLAPDDRVAVEIYRNDESGNMIYCETGDLNDEFHTYMGSGKISRDKAVAC